MSRSRGSSRSNKSNKRIFGKIRLIEELESRVLLTTYTVTNLNADGPGSLWADFQQVEANGGVNTIDFAAGLKGTITPPGGLVFDGAGTTTIVGPGASLLTLNTNVMVAGVAVATVSGVMIGPIHNASTLTIHSCVVSGNSVITDSTNGGVPEPTTWGR